MVRKKVSEVLARHIFESRSPLYRWLYEHYDDIAPVLFAQARPSWEALAKTVGEQSQLLRPSRQTVMKAWRTLEQDRKAGEERLNASELLSAKSHSTPQPMLFEEPTQDQFRWKPVSLRGVVKPKKEGN